MDDGPIPRFNDSQLPGYPTGWEPSEAYGCGRVELWLGTAGYSLELALSELQVAEGTAARPESGIPLTRMHHQHRAAKHQSFQRGMIKCLLQWYIPQFVMSMQTFE